MIAELKTEIKKLKHKVEISEIENKAEIEKIKKEKEHELKMLELKMLELKRKLEIEAESREVPISTTLPPLPTPKISPIEGKKLLEEVGDRIERRKRGEKLP